LIAMTVNSLSLIKGVVSDAEHFQNEARTFLHL